MGLFIMVLIAYVVVMQIGAVDKKDREIVDLQQSLMKIEDKRNRLQADKIVLKKVRNHYQAENIALDARYKNLDVRYSDLSTKNNKLENDNRVLANSRDDLDIEFKNFKKRTHEVTKNVAIRMVEKALLPSLEEQPRGLAYLLQPPGHLTIS